MDNVTTHLGVQLKPERNKFISHKMFPDNAP